MSPACDAMIEIFIKILEVCHNQLWGWTCAAGWARVRLQG